MPTGPRRGGVLADGALRPERARERPDGLLVLDLAGELGCGRVAVIAGDHQPAPLTEAIDELPEAFRSELLLDLRRDDRVAFDLVGVQVNERLVRPFVPEEETRLGRHGCDAVREGGVDHVGVGVGASKQE